MNEKFSFDRGWAFAREDLPAGFFDDPVRLIPSWQRVTLPHTVRYEPYENHGIPTWQGVASYCKCFFAPKALQDKCVFLSFGAVMGVADVYLNGHLLHTPFADAAPDQDGTVHTNCGGYLPFVVELTPFLRFDAQNVLTVRTDNRDAPQVPPGKPQALLDFTYFGGIYRNVQMQICEKIRITDPLRENIPAGGGVLWQTPVVTDRLAEAEVRTHVRNDSEQDAALTLTVALEDETGACIEKQTRFQLAAGSDLTVRLSLSIANPKLWRLDAPHLYTLRVTLLQGDTCLHEHCERVGIRSLSLSREQGVLLNGRRMALLSGVNRHQDYPVIGNAAPDSLQKEDALLYKNAGFSVVRAAHYPMAEAFLSACDELGIFVIEATPGWQWYPSADDEPFTTRVHQNIRQMVRRDRNHPCILAYETVLNETYHVPCGYTRRMEQTALDEAPDARVSAESFGYDETANGVDRLASLIYGFERPLEKTEKALMFLREYGDSWQEAYGFRMSRRVTRGTNGTQYPGGERVNLEKARNLLYDHKDGLWTLADCYRAWRENPAFAGCAVWTGIDSRGMGSEISPCGLWDAWRLNKTAMFALMSQRGAGKNELLERRGVKTGPVLHVADAWLEGDRSRTVEVFSNASRVRLQVKAGEKVFYDETALPMTDGLCAELPHPPFRFSAVPFISGSILIASGLDGAGRTIVQEIVRTPEKPAKIVLDAPKRPLLSGGSDLLLIHARVTDENGTLCPQAEPYITFRVEGGSVVGQESCFAAANPASAEAGIASAYIRAGDAAGEILVTASSPGLIDGTLRTAVIEAPMAEFPYTPLGGAKCRKCDSYDLADKLESGGTVCAYLDGGRSYPKSVSISNYAEFCLQRRYTRLYGRVHLADGAALQMEADGTPLAEFKKSGAFSLRVQAVERLTMRAERGAVLLSPYLSDQPVCERELRENLAANAKCTASSNAEDAQKVLQNGNPWERIWCSDPSKSCPQFFEVDLGTLQDIRDVMVHIGGQMGSDCTNYAYEIATSCDHERWTVRAKNRRTSWSNGVTDAFSAKAVRYVRVIFTQVDGGLLPAVSKIEIYAETPQQGG